jgi:hypothetical protein
LSLASDEFRLHRQIANLESIIDVDLNSDRAHKAVAFAHRVLAHCLFQLGDERFLKTIESLCICRSEPYTDVIGRDLTLIRESSSQIDLAYDPRSDFYWLQCVLEGSRKRLLEEALKAIFNTL